MEGKSRTIRLLQNNYCPLRITPRQDPVFCLNNYMHKNCIQILRHSVTGQCLTVKNYCMTLITLFVVDTMILHTCGAYICTM